MLAEPFRPGQDGPADVTKARFFWWEDGAWRLEPEEIEAKPRDKITMLTYNVWFGAVQIRTRLQGLMNVVRSSDADVVCLQEVVPTWARDLARLDWFRAKYATTDPYGDMINNYGLLVLIKRDLGRPDKAFWLHAPTKMDRFPLVAQFKIPPSNLRLTIASNHFESLRNKAYREAQVAIIGSVLLGKHKLFLSGPALVCGDFNFDSTKNFKDAPPPLENDCLRRWWPQHIDVWPALHPDDPGYTFDSFNNIHLRDKPQIETMRYDRIIYIPPEPDADNDLQEEFIHLTPISIELVGREWCIPPGEPGYVPVLEQPKAVGFFFTPSVLPTTEIPPSDHFGLLASFALEFP